MKTQNKYTKNITMRIQKLNLRDKCKYKQTKKRSKTKVKITKKQVVNLSKFINIKDIEEYPEEIKIEQYKSSQK